MIDADVGHRLRGGLGLRFAFESLALQYLPALYQANIAARAWRQVVARQNVGIG